MPVSKGKTMQENVTLSTGRVVAHKPVTYAGTPTGATEAFILSHYVISGIKIEKHSPLTNEEWTEYVNILKNQ